MYAHGGVSHAIRARPLLAMFLFLMVMMTGVGAQPSTRFCADPAPGVQRMLRGVDITELDLLPLDLGGFNGYKRSLIDLTCTRLDRQWTVDDDQYLIPDQVETMTPAAQGLLVSDVQIYRGSSDVREVMNHEVRGEDPMQEFYFSATPSFLRLDDMVGNGSMSITDVSAVDPISRVDLAPYWDLALGENVKEFMEETLQNKTYSENPEGYHRFIDRFGTHYFSSAKFGGRIRAVQPNTRHHWSQESVKHEAMNSFLQFLREETWNSTNANTIRFYGGSTALLTADSVKEWHSTLERSPWLLSGRLQPISSLIREEALRTGMEQAVKQHVLRRYLAELRRRLAVVGMSLGKLADSLATRLAAIEGQPLGEIAQADVMDLKKDIEAAAEVPAAFVEKTRLCYTWEDQERNGQCNSSEYRLCAGIGDMTPWYTDDTDDRQGGCTMAWGIMTYEDGWYGYRTYRNPWLNHVQICYRYKADGLASECGNGTSGTVCADAHSYTTESLDSTTSAKGGCKRSWRITVDDSAPQWMTKLQMCFSWRPEEDDDKQCGPAPSRDMCASANQWTPYYRDNTNYRPGGCEMSWGLKFAF